MVDAPSVVARGLRGQGTPVVEGAVATTMMSTGKPELLARYSGGRHSLATQHILIAYRNPWFGHPDKLF